jgi:hypothetical protein
MPQLCSVASAVSSWSDDLMMAIFAAIASFFQDLWAALKKVRHVYLAAGLIWYALIGWKSFLTSDIIFVIFLPAFFLYGKGLEYLRRFLPFVAIIIFYDSLRSLVPLFVHDVHFTEMISFDKLIGFGQIPTVQLQHLFYQGQLHWYDYYFYFSYLLHFLAPYIIGLLIWRYRPVGYWRFITALVVLSYGAFITYLLFPAAPPWMASNVGYIDHIHKISTDVWFSWGIKSYSTVYSHLNANPIAAVPSLHAAYPLLDLLFINRLFGKKIAIPFAIYPLSVWFGVVYLGEHYVFDVLLGILYALVAFYGTEFAFAYVKSKRSHRKIAHNTQSISVPRPVIE